MSLFDGNYWTIIAVAIIIILMSKSASHIAADLTGASGGDYTGATAAVVGAMSTPFQAAGAALAVRQLVKGLNSGSGGGDAKEEGIASQVTKGSQPGK